MLRLAKIFASVVGCLLGATLMRADLTKSDAAVAPSRGPEQVYVIPIKGEISEPTLYVVRRGLKDAEAHKAGLVIIDMDTPGGNLGTTLEILESISRFDGKTITYVDKDAVSAGAFIAAATNEIYFAPNGVIGAAAPVNSGGQDIDKTMKEKVVSYITARIRSFSEGKGRYRGQVISAMVDEDYELKIGDKTLKAKGGLLSLTASEANQLYGEPPQSLLGAGVAKDLDALLATKLGAGKYELKTLTLTWSEQLAQYMVAIRGIVLGLGLLALFVEFKTPGFGVFGVVGIILLAVVFLSSYVAGLSGHEPILIFALGLVLFLLEVFFFPGVAVVAVPGVMLMLGSLVWAMADLWPNRPIQFTGDVFIQPLISLGVGMTSAAVMAVLLLRFMPRGWLWDRMVLNSSVSGSAQVAGGAPDAGAGLDALIGRKGVTVTGLFPSGQVDIDGRRYEARVAIGTLVANTPVIVTDSSGFGLVVEKTSV